jgi:hypothetical protein
LNPRPTAYEAAAPPLSYRGVVMPVIDYTFKRNLDKNGLGPGDYTLLLKTLEVFLSFSKDIADDVLVVLSKYGCR